MHIFIYAGNIYALMHAGVQKLNIGRKKIYIACFNKRSIPKKKIRDNYSDRT